MLWNQIKFYFNQSWKSVKAKKLAYFSLYFANLIGLLLPLVLIFFYTSTYSMHLQSQVQDGERTAVITLRTDHSPLLPQGLEQFDSLGRSGIEFIYRDTTFSDSRFYIPRIVLIDENYSDFYDLRCSTGTFLSKEQIIHGEHACVISDDIRVQLFAEENPIGKEILISSQKYQVIGVMSKNTHFLKVFVPITTVKGSVKGGMPEKNILFRFNQDIDLAQAKTDISSFLMKKQIRFTWEWSNTIFERNMTNLAGGMSRDFMISLALCVFVVLNLGNIMFAVVDAERKVIGIKYALGVSKKQIFIEKTLSNCIITLMSLCTLLLILAVVTYGFKLSSLVGDAYKIILLPAFGIVLVLSIIEALFLMRKMFNDRIINLLQE